MRRYVLLSTLQSCGTWWAIDALRKHPEIGGLSHVQNLMALQNGWVLRDRWTGNPHNEAISTDDKATLLYEHYNAPAGNFIRWNPQSSSEYIMMVIPTLSPLRDPLACMIRAFHREPQLYPYSWLLDAWMHVAKRGDTLGISFWRMDPFDLNGFIHAVTVVGLSTPSEWTDGLSPANRINSTPGDCPLRIDYAQGDVNAIEKQLPEPWRRLRESEPILRPFLEQYGFSGLLWWS